MAAQGPNKSQKLHQTSEKNYIRIKTKTNSNHKMMAYSMEKKVFQRPPMKNIVILLMMGQAVQEYTKRSFKAQRLTSVSTSEWSTNLSFILKVQRTELKNLNEKLIRPTYNLSRSRKVEIHLRTKATIFIVSCKSS